MATRSITYTITATRVALRGFRQTSRAILRIGTTASNVSKKVTKLFLSMSKSVISVSTKIGLALGALAVTVSGFALNLAKNAEEVENKFRVVFQGMTEEANKWINSYSKAVGRSRYETKKTLSDTQDLLVGFGATGEEAFKYSKSIQKLGIDLASFHNLQDEYAMHRIRKGLLGEHENLKALGIIINENILNQEAVNQGYADGYKELSELTKIQLRYDIAMRQSRNAIGDAERTVGSLTNQLKAAKYTFIDVATTLGSYFIPAATAVVSTVNNKLANAFEFVQTKLTPRIEKFTVVGSIFIRLLRYMGDQIAETLGIKKIPLGDTILKGVTGATNLLESFTVFLFENREGIINFVANTVKGFSRVINSIIEFGKSSLIFKLIGKYINFQIGNYKLLFETIMKLKPIFSEVFGKIVNYINTTFKPTFDKINDRIIKFGLTVFENLPQIKEIFTDVFDTLSETVLPLLITVFEDYINNILPAIIDNFLDIAERVIPLVIDAFEMAWELIKPVLVLLSTAIIAIYPIISKVFIGIVNIVSEKISSFVLILDGVITFVTGVFTANWSKAWEGIKKIFIGIFENMFAAIKPVLNDLIDNVNDLINKVNDFIKLVPGLSKLKIPTIAKIGSNSSKDINWGSGSIPQIGAGSSYAKGTSYSQGGLSLVGEEGAELVNLPRGSRVINHNKTINALNQRKSNSVIVNLNINTNGNTPGSQFVREIKEPIKREVENIFKSLSSEMGLI